MGPSPIPAANRLSHDPIRLNCNVAFSDAWSIIVLPKRQRLGSFAWPRDAFFRIGRTSGQALRECRLRCPHFLNARPAVRAAVE